MDLKQQSQFKRKIRLRAPNFSLVGNKLSRLLIYKHEPPFKLEEKRGLRRQN